MIERMEGELGEHHAGELRRERAEWRAERIIAEELSGRGWTEAELGQRRRSDPVKLALGARLRRAFAAPTLAAPAQAAPKVSPRREATPRRERLRPRRRETTLTLASEVVPPRTAWASRGCGPLPIGQRRVRELTKVAMGKCY